MYKEWKNSNIFFLWIAGLFILLHVIIPHHHHLDTHLSHKNRNLLPAWVQKNNTEDSPLHCHAFNGITFDKVYDATDEITNIQIAIYFLIVFSEPLCPCNSLANKINYTNTIVTTRQYLSSSFYLRGPPLEV